MTENNRKKSVIAFLILTIIFALAFIFKDNILSISRFFPECYFRKITGKLCPACGNTHAVKELMHGHFITACKYNITIPLLSVIIAALYIELCFSAFGKNVKILPRSSLLWFVLLGIMAAYYILRMLLL